MTMTLASVNGKYSKKAVSYKCEPDLKLLAIEKCKGQGRVSFKHVPKPRYKITLTFFGQVLIGKMIQITDIRAAQTIPPFIMKATVLDKLEVAKVKKSLVSIPSIGVLVGWLTSPTGGSVCGALLALLSAEDVVIVGTF
jgi:hypothetical protein